ncbi:MAG: extracellular elastinolytic metalloproteinase, partial [Saprospiraceae bacterium]
MNLKNTFTRCLLFAVLFQIPGLSFAQQQSPLDVALRYIEQNREDLRLTGEDIRHYQVSDLYTSTHNGVTHIYLNQEHQNIKVLNAIININILPDGKVLNIGNRFIPSLQEKVNGSSPAITPVVALQKVIDRFDIKSDMSIRLQSQISDQHFIFDQADIALDPVSVKLVYQKIDDKSVRLAWMVQLYELGAQHWWNAKIDAHSGEMLTHHDQVIHCNFNKPEENCTAYGHDHPILKNNMP